MDRSSRTTQVDARRPVRLGDEPRPEQGLAPGESEARA